MIALFEVYPEQLTQAYLGPARSLFYVLQSTKQWQQQVDLGIRNGLCKSKVLNRGGVRVDLARNGDDEFGSVDRRCTVN